jgi:hypothetical protein
MQPLSATDQPRLWAAFTAFFFVNAASDAFTQQALQLVFETWTGSFWDKLFVCGFALVALLLLQSCVLFVLLKLLWSVWARLEVRECSESVLLAELFV